MVSEPFSWLLQISNFGSYAKFTVLNLTYSYNSQFCILIWVLLKGGLKTESLK